MCVNLYCSRVSYALFGRQTETHTKHMLRFCRILSLRVKFFVSSSKSAHTLLLCRSSASPRVLLSKQLQQPAPLLIHVLSSTQPHQKAFQQAYISGDLHQRWAGLAIDDRTHRIGECQAKRLKPFQAPIRRIEGERLHQNIERNVGPITIYDAKKTRIWSGRVFGLVGVFFFVEWGTHAQTVSQFTEQIHADHRQRSQVREMWTKKMEREMVSWYSSVLVSIEYV